jgi:hypothetical protein
MGVGRELSFMISARSSFPFNGPEAEITPAT